MAFKTDILQIAPADTGTRLVQAEAVTGKLRLFDPSAPTGINLDQIASIAVDDVYIVGSAGVGATYTTITDAMAAVRASSGTEHLILVFPGTYAEAATVTVDVPNVTIKAMGRVVVGNGGGVAPAFTVVESATIPTRVVLDSLRISSIVAGVPAVDLIGNDGSTVGLDGIILKDCQWETTGTAMALRANLVNHIVMDGGSMRDCAGGSTKITVTTCASFIMNGVIEGSSVQADYTDIGDEPIDSGSYVFSGSQVASLLSTLTNKGALEVIGCTGGFLVTFRGTQEGRFLGSYLGALAVRDTAQAVLGSSYTSLATDATATVTEPILTGTGTLAGLATTATVTLPYLQPDTDYVVTIDMITTPLVSNGVTTKNTGSFIAEFATADAGARSFDWSLTRVVKA